MTDDEMVARIANHLREINGDGLGRLHWSVTVARKILPLVKAGVGVLEARGDYDSYNAEVLLKDALRPWIGEEK